MNSQVNVVKAEPIVTEVPPVLPEAVTVAFFAECNVCHERFALQEDHVLHMTCHQESHPAACRRCPSQFATPQELSEHIKQQHVTVQRRRKPGPAKVDRVLRCVICGIDSFPNFSYFHDHHLYHHLVTRPEPTVTLERSEPAAAAAAAAAALKLTLRRSSQEQNGGSQFEVIPSDGCSSAGSDSGMDASEPASLSGAPLEAPPSPAERLPSDEGLAPGEDDSRWSAGEMGVADEDSLSQGPTDALHVDAAAGDDDALAEDGEAVDPLDDHYGDEGEPDEPGAIDPDFDTMHTRLSDGSGSGSAEGDEETVDNGLSSDTERPGGSSAGDGTQAEEGVIADVLPEGEEQDDVLRLLDSLNREGARSASTPPPPRLLPVGSPAMPQRMTASAPPADIEAGSPAPPRSVASDPGGTGDTDGPAPTLQDLAPQAADGESAPPAEGADGQPAGDQAEGGSGQPLIRMAAIAANIPDERSFRHEPPATPQPPQLQPRPDGARLPAPAVSGAAGLPPLTQGVRPPAPPGSVSCFVCQLPLPNVAALQEHLLTHQDQLQCSMCPFKASSINDLKAHSVTFHGKMQAGAVGRPPNSNMSSHMAAMQSPMTGVGRPPMPVPPGTRFPHIRRGRPPLDATRIAQMQHMNGLRGRGMMGPRGMQPGRMPGISPQKRPAPGMMAQDPKRRPGIPIQPDKSDCQVIAVQRRQQGVPVIQNVEGSAHGGNQGTIRLSDSITLSVQQPAPAATSAAAAPNADVASILANRGISITPAASAPAPPAAQPPISLPNLPAGISLTPASSANDNFAVPRPPGVQQTNVSRPARPPTVDLTVDTPSPPARGSLTCRYCERTMPSMAALVQHEKAHLSGPNQSLRCRVCGIVMQNLALLQQHMQSRHGSTLPPTAPGRGSSELVVPVFDLSQVSRDQLEALGVRGFLPVSQVNQRQGQLGLPIISLQGLGKTGPSPRPVAFFNLGPVRPLR
ncbi:collagen alpha-1(III) chain-like isoform X1 [Amphibalanus amphitrite]|uniref:collagen alpha-1(III) chain-like isoform X1 n=1 Tax=Amphibalanus amphitrite TaxID=1232801 RepID=UPI001C92AC53|nr:collagen alpha-1(III) chain-like isoform X1 [Amphibalanus amphitrite]